MAGAKKVSRTASCQDNIGSDGYCSAELLPAIDTTTINKRDSSQGSLGDDVNAAGASHSQSTGIECKERKSIENMFE